jgi:hypothetical protein
VPIRPGSVIPYGLVGLGRLSEGEGLAGERGDPLFSQQSGSTSVFPRWKIKIDYPERPGVRTSPAGTLALQLCDQGLRVGYPAGQLGGGRSQLVRVVVAGPGQGSVGEGGLASLRRGDIGG